MKPLYKKTLIIFLLLFSGGMGLIASLHNHPTENNFVPPKDVVVIQTFHYPEIFAKQLQHDPEAGKKIFNQFCTSCHGKNPMIDIQAPRINDKKAWDIRRKMGIEILLKITTTGVSAMPARGGCFECTDEELKQTIKYILQKSNQE